MNKRQFTIDKITNSKWYVYCCNDYLLNDGRLLDWYGDILKLYPNIEKRDKVVFFQSKKEAEQCLDKFLKGNFMNLQERLAQCRIDKEAIEKKEKELLEQIKKEEIPEIRHGDYGYYGGNKNDPVIWIDTGDKLTIVNHSFLCDSLYRDEDKKNFTKVGNIFDELKGK